MVYIIICVSNCQFIVELVSSFGLQRGYVVFPVALLETEIFMPSLTT